ARGGSRRGRRRRGALLQEGPRPARDGGLGRLRPELVGRRRLRHPDGAAQADGLAEGPDRPLVRATPPALRRARSSTRCRFRPTPFVEWVKTRTNREEKPMSASNVAAKWSSWSPQLLSVLR